MNVFTYITGFQGFFYSASLLDSQNLEKKKQKTAKTYTNAQILVITISILIISQYSNM